MDTTVPPAAAAKPPILKQIFEERLMSRPIQSNLIQKASNRRSFLKKGVAAAGAATVGAAMFPDGLRASQEESSGNLHKGDAAILRFLAAAEILETDLWQQYNELAGVQVTSGPSFLYVTALEQLDGDMPQYISDNTDDELTHEQFINAYLASKGAQTVDLTHFATLPSSKADGAKQVGRLTNLMHLNVDTSWWTRYRSSTKNPDLGDTFPQAVPTLAVGQHTAIPRTDNDLNDPNFLQAIANTAAFHFPTIEQGGNSLYPSMAQRATHVEVLRILISIGPTETMHFQTWSDKAGNAPPLTAVDPVTGVSVTFPDLSNAGENLNKSLIMPEPCPFLSRNLPRCSIIRPTETKGVAMGAVKFLTDMGLFIGQPPAFFSFLHQLAQAADAAQRED